MKVEQLYTGCLAEAAYYIESEGEVAIIDPLREYQPYIDKANAAGGKIKYVFETHFHADFVSGHIDLAAHSGAEIVYGPSANTNFKSVIATDGQIFKIGKITIEVMHTPGHTPESSCFLLRNENNKPHCVFTGDTLFIGDVGRPDLAIKSNVTREDLAGMLFDSLRKKVMILPDDIIIYPGHGAGSSCGKNLSSETWSTLGEQKKSNYALQNISRDEFIKQVTSGILPPPQYFAKNAALNKNGYASVDGVIQKGNTALDINTLDEKIKNGALILDVRSKEQFSNSFIPGSIFIGLDGTFAMWVGALIKDLNQPIVLICPEGKESEAVTRLARVGYDNTQGYLKGGFETWKNAGRNCDNIDAVSAQKLAELYPQTIVDVRKPGEYEAGHVENAVLYPLDFINEHLHELDKNKHLYLHCKSGYRSVIAISLLKREGYTKLTDVIGGWGDIEKTNLPLVDVCTKG